MAEIEKEKLPFSQLHHLCIVVKDLEKARKYYESLGMGPFGPPKTVSRVPDEIKRRITYTETFAQMGPIVLQLLQPSAKGDDVFKNIFRRFLDKHGEGVQHICFYSDNIKRDVATLVKKGFELIDGQYYPTGGGEAFLTFDTSGDSAGVCIQILDKTGATEAKTAGKGR